MPLDSLKEDVFAGSISLTNVSDLIQFIGMSGKTGELVLINEKSDEEGKLYFTEGKLFCVLTGIFAGIEALSKILLWNHGKFFFTRDISSIVRNIDMPLNHAIMEAARLSDESGQASLFDDLDEDDLFSSFDDEPVKQKDLTKKSITAELKVIDENLDFKETVRSLPAGFGLPPLKNSWTASMKSVPAKENSEKKVSSSNLNEIQTINSNGESSLINERSELEMRESTEILSDLLKVPGVDAVVVAGRDGFIIETAGSSNRINVDDLGAAMANTINGIEEMGKELNVNKYQDLFIEYGRAVIMCKPVGDAIAAIISPDASKLGIIRHKASKLFDELKEIF